jgi:hypothetical protein
MLAPKTTRSGATKHANKFDLVAVKIEAYAWREEAKPAVIVDRL